MQVITEATYLDPALTAAQKGYDPQQPFFVETDRFLPWELLHIPQTEPKPSVAGANSYALYLSADNLPQLAGFIAWCWVPVGQGRGRHVAKDAVGNPTWELDFAFQDLHAMDIDEQTRADVATLITQVWDAVDPELLPYLARRVCADKYLVDNWDGNLARTLRKEWCEPSALTARPV